MSETVISQHAPSLSEWFGAMGNVTRSNEFRQEDNTKDQRLALLKKFLGAPFDEPTIFNPQDALDRTPAFEKFFQERKDKNCAFRLVPHRPDLPKIRSRGLTVEECYNTWFVKQEFNPADYDLHIHMFPPGTRWSAIFVVSEKGIFGEVVEGIHMQLTQGTTEHPLYQFFYDYKKWKWNEQKSEVEEVIKAMLLYITTDDTAKQAAVTEALNMPWSNNYLQGYFEAVIRPDGELIFIDYNRILPRYIQEPPAFFNGPALVKGAVAYPGVVQGKAVILPVESIEAVEFNDGDILVCDNTDVRYLAIMKKAGAIITNRGGILSHAAIVARELKKPCIIGTGTATTSLKNGDLVEVDANKGTIRLIDRRKNA